MKAKRIIGVLLVLVGGVWFLQGIGVEIGDSFMIGSSTWVLIGAVVVIAGVGLLATTRRR